MTREELFNKAKDLLHPYENRYYNTLSEVHWIEQDQCSTDGDYCKNCIEKALKKVKKEYKTRKKEILEKYKEIKETGKYKGVELDESITKKRLSDSKKYELDQLGTPEFRSTYNYGGGYESDYFSTCDDCGEGLNIVILPNESDLKDSLEYFIDTKDDPINDREAYKAYGLIYNCWEDREGYEDQLKLTIELAKKVIEKLEIK